MPSYATIDNLRDRVGETDLIELTDDERTGSVVESRVLTALTQADAQIDGYVGRYYRRLDAVAPVPALLVELACDIAHYRLFRFQTPTERVEELYKQAVSALRDIAKGVITLDQGEEQLPARDGQVLISSAERTFTRDSMRGL